MFPLFLLAQAVSLPADSQTRRPTQVTHKFSGSELSPQTLNLGLLSRFHLVVQNISESSVTSAIRVDGFIINSAVSTLCFSTTFVYTGCVQRNELYCTNSHIKQVTEHGWQYWWGLFFTLPREVILKTNPMPELGLIVCFKDRLTFLQFEIWKHTHSLQNTGVPHRFESRWRCSVTKRRSVFVYWASKETCHYYNAFVFEK